MMKVLGNPDITPELKQTIVDGVLREAGDRSVEQLAQEENELLVGLLGLRETAHQELQGRSGKLRWSLNSGTPDIHETGKAEHDRRAHGK